MMGRPSRDNRDNGDREREWGGESSRQRERDMEYEELPADRSGDIPLEYSDENTYNTGHHDRFSAGGGGGTAGGYNGYDGYANEVCYNSTHAHKHNQTGKYNI